MGFKTRRSEAQRGKHGAKKSKQVHGEPSSTSPSDDAVRMDVDHGASLSVTRLPRRAPTRSRMPRRSSVRAEPPTLLNMRKPSKKYAKELLGLGVTVPASVFGDEHAAAEGPPHARFESWGEQTSTPTRLDRVHGLWT